MRSTLITAFLLLAGAFLLSLSSAQSADTEEISRPFEYAGYSEPLFETLTVSSEYVVMRDDTKIAIDVYLPDNGGADLGGGYPTVFMYTPYQRSSVDPKTGKVFDLSEGIAKFFTSYGYAVVCADMRGTGASTNWEMDFIPEIADDGKELVDWFAEQPWCDGNVGMMGGSYLGWSQTATASRAPKALKCIMPTVIPLEGYTGEVYPGGIYLQGFLKLWSGAMYHSHRNHFLPDGGSRPTKPVIDEDGDGELADEIPLDHNGDGSFLDEPYPPTYSDGNDRKHVYYQATKDHEGNYDYAAWAKSQFFIDAKSPLEHSLYDLGPNAHIPGIIESGLPVYNVGGWFDGFARGSFELYRTLEKSNPSKVVMHPGYHNVTGGPYYEFVGEDQKAANPRLMMEHLRFFDRYLKGIENGVDTEDPITIYTMHGKGWHTEKEWPLAREARKVFYLGAENSLDENAVGSGSDPYEADYSHSSTYGENEGNRWVGVGGKTPSALPVRTEKDKKCLVYDTAPLDENLEVAGHPIVDLWVSSDADYGDFFVYLEDVDEKGEAVLVTEAQLRAGFAALIDNDEIVYSGERGCEVLPELIWHGYEKDQYVDAILKDGAVVNLKIDFLPTSWVFRKGHRIRVSIACSDSPTFRLHPKLCPTNDPSDPNNIVPTITIHRDPARPSRLDLPVIP